jgi:hypothetical protein
MTQIDWVRATFMGAIFGGFVWAVIVRLASLDFLAMGWQARTIVAALVVNAVVLVISWLIWRSATDERGRSCAAAMWIVPFVGVAFFAAVYTIGVGFGALRSS